MTKTKAPDLARLSDEEFNAVRKNTYLKPEVQNLWQQLKSQNDLKNSAFSLNKEQQALLLMITEEEIRRKIEQLCFLQYAMMKQSGNWTDVGQERILYSLTRLLQQISYESPLSYELINQTRRLLNEKIVRFAGLDEEGLNAEEEKLLIDLGWKKAKFSSYQIINDFLSILGSNKRLILGQLELYSSIIFGKTTVAQYSDITVYTFHEEIIHTPAIITSIAAMVKDQEIIIREASAKTIFYNKWLETFNQLRSDTLAQLLKSKAENVSLAIKLKTLLAYGVFTEKKLLAKKSLFIKEILEGLLWHEMGHAVTLNYFMSNKQVALDEALSVLGETASSVAKELLADLAPPGHDTKGALSFISSCSGKKAQRMLMVYLSDNWFITAHDNFFKNHTELMLSNILPYINEQGIFQKDELKAALENKYQEILTEYKCILDEFLLLLKTGQYQLAEQTVNFEDLFSQYRWRYRQFTRFFSKKEREAYIYARIINDLEKLDPRLNQKILERLQELDDLYHSRINLGKETTLNKVYQQMKAKQLFLKPDLDLSIFADQLDHHTSELITKSLQDDLGLEINTIVKNKNVLRFFSWIFYTLGLSAGKELSGQDFVAVWEEYLKNNLLDDFYFPDSEQINASTLFSLLFQAAFVLAPEKLFHETK